MLHFRIAQIYGSDHSIADCGVHKQGERVRNKCVCDRQTYVYGKKIERKERENTKKTKRIRKMIFFCVCVCARMCVALL